MSTVIASTLPDRVQLSLKELELFQDFSSSFSLDKPLLAVESDLEKGSLNSENFLSTAKADLSKEFLGSELVLPMFVKAGLFRSD